MKKILKKMLYKMIKSDEVFLGEQRRSFGCIKSTKDERDYQYCNVRDIKTDLPSAFELKSLSVRDQGSAGTCVGMAIGITQETDAMVRYNKEPERLSPLYIYAETKAVDGIDGEGTSIKTAMSILTKKGICEENLYPYSDSRDIINLKFPERSTEAYKNSEKYKTKGYAQINNLQELKNAIYRDNGAVLGVLITDSFMDAPKGVIDVPLGYIYGMHAIPAIGWDDEKEVTIGGVKYKGCIKIQNSWGKTWGDQGYGYVPYEVYNYRSKDGFIEFVNDAWTSYDFENEDSNKDYHKKENETVVPEEELLIKMTIGSKTVTVNGVNKTMAEAPKVTNGTTMVPIRFLSEILGCKVEWNQKTKEITIRR